MITHDDKQRLLTVAVSCSIAGATAICMVIIPHLWHDAPPPAASLPVAFDWPDKPLAEPSLPPPSVIASIDLPVFMPSEIKHVVTEKILLMSTKEKTPPVERPERAERRDYCYPGHRVDYGRHRWRCVYPHGRHHRR